MPKRPDILDGAPLHYAPKNELGVVFLFAHLIKRWQLRVETISAGFPDCIAYQKVQGGEKLIRIEFEHESKNFKNHHHDPNGCDWIVCWEHNWFDAPQNLEIIELRKEYGLGFNIWIVPVKPELEKELLQFGKSVSVPSQAHKNDLILFYFSHPKQFIADIFVLNERAVKTIAGWKNGKDYMAPIKRVCRLKAPIFFEDLKRHRILSTSNFVRGKMQARPNVIEYWPYLYEIIIKRNPSVKPKLKKYAPENLSRTYKDRLTSG